MEKKTIKEYKETIQEYKETCPYCKRTFESTSEVEVRHNYLAHMGSCKVSGANLVKIKGGVKKK